MGVLWAAPASAAPKAGSSPVMQDYPGAAKPGESITVSGAGFPPDTNVQTQVCGNEALDGSADCVLSTAQEVSTTPKGKFTMALTVTIPPTPCPCVVLAIDDAMSATPTVPITIIGGKNAPPRKVALKDLKILSAQLEGDGSVASWFGAPPGRTLVITVQNPNASPYQNPPLILSIGEQTNTTTEEATTQPLATIGGEQTVTYRVPVSFPALSIGQHQIVGVLGNAGLSRSFEVKTWLFPWGLLVVALILLEVIALTITRAVRRRRRRREADAAPPEEREDGDPPTEELLLGVGNSGDGAMLLE